MKPIKILISFFVIIIIWIYSYLQIELNSYLKVEKLTITSDIDKDWINDIEDILQWARNEVKNKTHYKSAYYSGDYPSENEWVCTDVVWRVLKNAWIDLKTLMDSDIKNNISKYKRVEWKPDPNIDFRRVPNLDTFLQRKAVSLTIKIIPIFYWTWEMIPVEPNNWIGDWAESLDYLLNKSNVDISKENWYYYKSIIAEEKEFTFNNTLENNDFLYKQANIINKKYIRWDRPICVWMPNKESCVKEWYWNILNRYIVWNNTYDLIWDLQNQDKYYIFKNDKLIFEDTIEMVWAWSPYMTYQLDNKLLFIYTKNNWDDTVLYNILFDEENINKKYEFKNIDWYFRYNWKEWFIVDKTKLFFDWKFLPYTFDFIQNRACCTSPSLFDLYDNWMLIFANKRGNSIDDLEFDLIEVDLNDY